MKRAIVLLFLLSGCTLTAKNDAFTFFNKDSHLTHGTELSNETDERRIAVGQRIYTPISKHETEVVEDERPYAGYLYGSYEELEEVEPGITLLAGVEAGIVGPSALAKQSQCTVHKMLGQGCPAGWGNQLENEVGVSLRSGIQVHQPLDLILSSGQSTTYATATIGNVLSELALSHQVRANIGQMVYLEFGPRLHLVAHDIFLDGNTWETSHSVDKKLWYSEVVGTLGIRIDPILIEWSLVLQSPQYVEQETSYNLGVVRISLLN